MDQMTAPMTIEINRHPQDEDFCTVKIDNNVSPVEIETRLAVPKLVSRSGGRWAPKVDVSKVEEWVGNIKNGPDRIIGISTEHETHYKNNNGRRFCVPGLKITSSTPYDILQFCVGNQCLLYDPDISCGVSKKRVPKALKDLLSNGKFTVVGVGMEEVAKNLEENLGLKISRARDLGKMAGVAHDVGDLYCEKKGKFGVVKPAERVLKEKWAKWTNRNGLCWFRDGGWMTTLSDEKVKYGTLDALLAFKLGKELIDFA